MPLKSLRSLRLFMLLRPLRLLKPKGKLGEDADEEKIRAAWNRTTQQGSGLPARELGTQKSWKSKGQRSWKRRSCGRCRTAAKSFLGTKNGPESGPRGPRKHPPEPYWRSHGDPWDPWTGSRRPEVRSDPPGPRKTKRNPTGGGPSAPTAPGPGEAKLREKINST